MNVVWSPRGRKRLESYARYIAEHDYPQTAYNWLLDMRSATEHLADFPQAGREAPEFAPSEIREITHRGYRLFYRVKRNTCEIISIRHERYPIFSMRSL